MAHCTKRITNTSREKEQLLEDNLAEDVPSCRPQPSPTMRKHLSSSQLEDFVVACSEERLTYC